jgi:hypothetical protein
VPLLEAVTPPEVLEPPSPQPAKKANADSEIKKKERFDVMTTDWTPPP